MTEPMTDATSPDQTAQERFCPTCGARTPESVCSNDNTPTVEIRGFRRHPRSFQIGDVVAGRYRITGALGAGGFAAVYSAEHTGTGQAIALKLMVSDQSTVTDVAVRRFFREARVTASLSSPNTVRVYDIGQDPDGPLYIAMELLPGKTLHGLLKERLTAGSAMTEAETLDMASQVLASLAEAHDKKLVHRDLKPGNIIMMEQPDQPIVVKVLDFGIARTEDSSLTAAGAAPGTPAFMSPEQCKGDQVDGRSDLYALGVLMYACACGRLPFESRETLQLMHMHLTMAAPDPRSVAKQPLSHGFAAIVLKALAKKPDHRFADAREMRKAIAAVAAGTWMPDAEAPPEVAPPRPASTVLPAEPVARPVSAAMDAPTTANRGAIGRQTDQNTDGTPPSVVIQLVAAAAAAAPAPSAEPAAIPVAAPSAQSPAQPTARPPWAIWAGAAALVAIVAAVVSTQMGAAKAPATPPEPVVPALSADQQKARVAADMAATADSAEKALMFAKEAQRLDPANADYGKLVERLEKAIAVTGNVPAPVAGSAPAPVAGSAPAPVAGSGSGSGSGSAPVPAPLPAPVPAPVAGSGSGSGSAPAAKPKPAKQADKSVPALAPKLMD